MEVENLFKEYSGKQVLKNINFRIKKGEIFILVGPNGAGKTTLLRILDLLDEPTSGKVLFDGELVEYSTRNKEKIRRKIGMVFQQTVLFNMSVFDNVAYPLKVRGENERNIERKVKEMLELVRLHGFEYKNALDLSGGEAQRVALAQALIYDPELLLLDEPTANLDPRNVSIIEEVLSRINLERETTIIMTTHNMFQAKNLAHRVAVLINGKIEGIGTFQEIFRKPSESIKNFSSSENVFFGISKISMDGTSIIDIDENLQIEAAFRKDGNVIFHIPPEDIIISKDHFISSARNVFKGKIIEISDLGPIVKLKIDIGKIFTVQITKRSFNEMGLNLGMEVFLAFKASSVQII